MRWPGPSRCVRTPGRSRLCSSQASKSRCSRRSSGYHAAGWLVIMTGPKVGLSKERFEGLFMRMGLKYTGTFLFAILAGTIVTLGAHAEEALRWKFKVGEKLDYNMVQEMKMAISGAPFPMPLKTDMRQEMNMRWDVLGVDDKSGEAVIRQKFERVKMKMNSPLGAFDYDSKSEEPPT